MTKAEKKVMEWYVKGKCKLMEFGQKFLREEKGANTMVEVVVIIALVVVVAGIFREQLSSIVTTAFSKVTEFVSGGGGEAGGIAGLRGW